ncbi:uncharacterized protein BKA78DRAFT_8318 [Phyllosticta capitalensis]|uniref:uncharacterized protein n=1 Tax=Phyllosticta capitalensis TaxID=121624 RepID=UPI003131D508
MNSLENKEKPRLFPIAEKVRKCLESFRVFSQNALCPAVDDVGSISASEVSDATDRFRIWAGNIGAHRKDRGSLDYRLRDASHIQSGVLDLLNSLLNKTEKASAILQGHRTPFEKLALESDSDSDTSLEFDETTYPGGNEPPHEETELGQLMKGVKQSITDLLRISMVIRKPAAHDHFAHFNQVPTSHFEVFDLRHIQDKFPKASPILVERLAKATSSRRNYLKYREDRQINLSAGIENFESLDSSSRPPPSIVATSLNTVVKNRTQLDDDAYSDAGATETSFASSFQGELNNELKLPRIPKEGRVGAPFQCPLCFGIISAKTENAWKKHVSRDLTPYVCTFDSCSIPFRRFEKRRDWFEHELSHRSSWKCPQNCGKVFGTQEELSEHLKEHPGTSSAFSRAFQVRPEAISCVECPLCKKELRLSQLQSHLGEHQQQLALFALPLQIKHSENDEDFDEDSETPEEDMSVTGNESDAEASENEEEEEEDELVNDATARSLPDLGEHLIGEPDSLEDTPYRGERTQASGSITPVYFQCAFEFMGCPYVVTQSNEREWKKHVLSHFLNHKPPRHVACPFPGCDWGWEDEDDSRSWDIRMNHVAAHHRAGQRLERSPEARNFDSNLIRYLWQKRIISDAEYEDLAMGKKLPYPEPRKGENNEEGRSATKKAETIVSDSPSLDSLPETTNEPVSDKIKCVCGYGLDDGSSVLCEICQTWQHVLCFYDNEGQVPQKHECVDCHPRPLEQNRIEERRNAFRDMLKEDSEQDSSEESSDRLEHERRSKQIKNEAIFKENERIEKGEDIEGRSAQLLAWKMEEEENVQKAAAAAGQAEKEQEEEFETEVARQDEDDADERQHIRLYQRDREHPLEAGSDSEESKLETRRPLPIDTSVPVLNLPTVIRDAHLTAGDISCDDERRREEEWGKDEFHERYVRNLKRQGQKSEQAG